MEALIAGPDDYDIAGELTAQGVSVTHIDGVITRPKLEEAGVETVDLYVLTDVSQATTIPIVYDLNDTARLVAYASDTIPEFVRGQIDLAIDPRIVSVSVLAEELATSS